MLRRSRTFRRRRFSATPRHHLGSALSVSVLGLLGAGTFRQRTLRRRTFRRGRCMRLQRQRYTAVLDVICVSVVVVVLERYQALTCFQMIPVGIYYSTTSAHYIRPTTFIIRHSIFHSRLRTCDYSTSPVHHVDCCCPDCLHGSVPGCFFGMFMCQAFS